MQGWTDRRTIGQVLDDVATEHGPAACLIFGDQRITFAQLKLRVDAVAGGLLRLGLKPGDKVALWLHNRLEFLYIFFAVAKIGALLVPINTRFTAAEAEYVLRQSNAKALIFADRIHTTDYLGHLRDLLPEMEQMTGGALQSPRLPDLCYLICDSETVYPGLQRLQQLTDEGARFPAHHLARVAAAVGPDDPMFIAYTSGTTGFPKGVVHAHYLVQNTRDVGERVAFTPRDCGLIYLPLFHGFGLFTAFLSGFIRGVPFVLMERFEAGEALKLIQQEQVTLLYGFDTHFRDLLEHPAFSTYDLRSLRTGIMATGVPRLEPLIQEVLTRLCRVGGAYGLSEGSFIATLTRLDDADERRYAGSGCALPAFELKIVDPDIGATQPPGVAGEICLRGFPIMQGYYNKPAETARAIDTEGWLHTGDMGTMDAEGYLRFLGRYKEMLKVGGENVDPMEVETLLQRHPSVSLAQVVGVPDRRLAEVGMAFVQLKEGAIVTEQELIAFCQDKLARFKIPRYVHFVKEYPMTASGKVQKFKLQEMGAAELGPGHE
ncbi:MAG: AMP-binding protein [Nitrospinae bacterium]|nr:AMP-binding protein [Nitrospinota bacterium]